MQKRAIQNASWKRTVLTGAVFLCMFLPMNRYVSGLQKRFGVTLMDFRFGGYGADTVWKTLSLLGTEGRTALLHLLPLDCLMGILYLGFLTSLLGLSLKHCPAGKQKRRILLLLPLLAMLSDWTENLMDLLAVLRFPKISAAATAVESAATTLKFVFLGLSLAGALLLFLAGRILQRRAGAPGTAQKERQK